MFLLKFLQCEASFTAGRFGTNYTCENVFKFSECRTDEVACGENQPRVLSDFKGTVLSPAGFIDGIYPPNANCSWLIDLPDTNKVRYILYCLIKKGIFRDKNISNYAMCTFLWSDSEDF